MSDERASVTRRQADERKMRRAPSAAADEADKSGYDVMPMPR